MLLGLRVAEGSALVEDNTYPWTGAGKALTTIAVFPCRGWLSAGTWIFPV